MSRPTQDTLTLIYLYAYRTFTSYGVTFQTASASNILKLSRVLQPRTCQNKYGLGYSPFDRHYWGNHLFVLFSSGY